MGVPLFFMGHPDNIMFCMQKHLLGVPGVLGVSFFLYIYTTPRYAPRHDERVICVYIFSTPSTPSTPTTLQAAWLLGLSGCTTGCTRNSGTPRNGEWYVKYFRRRYWFMGDLKPPVKIGGIKCLKRLGFRMKPLSWGDRECRLEQSLRPVRAGFAPLQWQCILR